MKLIWTLVAVVIVGVGAWALYGMKGNPSSESSLTTATTTESSAQNGVSYAVDVAASKIQWAGTKPLIPGYVDSGTFTLKEGTLTVNGATGSGNIVLDMNAVHVGLTAKKPGMESMLEKHLKGKDFFDVAQFPTATFAITDVKSRADTASSSMYDISGTLTIKGVTNPVTFPAKIYLQDAKLHAEASFTIDRTKWGITFGSKDFFASLAENAISNDVKLDLSVVASPK